jgi:hypothetical protein
MRAFGVFIERNRLDEVWPSPARKNPAGRHRSRFPPDLAAAFAVAFAVALAVKLDNFTSTDSRGR